MRTRKMLGWQVMLGTLLAIPIWSASSAAAGNIYSWRTDDGVFAFTDDPTAIPARYRDEARSRWVQGLSDYEKHTEQVKGTNQSYAQALEERLEYLRKLNAEPIDASRRAAGVGVPTIVSLRVGGGDPPSIQVSAGTTGGPVVIENRYTRPAGGIVTRESTIVTQDGRIVAVVLPRPKETDPTEILDEAQLLR